MNYQASNPEYWVVYYKVGQYYQQKKWYNAAAKQYKTALNKEITTLLDRAEIQKKYQKVTRKIK